MRVFRRSIVLAALVLAAGPGTVYASSPVAGGRYSERSREDGARIRIVLTPANDGREFARPSYAIAAIRPRRGVLGCEPARG